MSLNERRIELQNERPVTKDEIIRFLDNSNRIQWRGKYDDKTQRIYIASTDRGGQERYDLLAEVEITSIGYILRGRDGHCYQGESYEDFKNDINDAVLHFDSNVFDTLGESGEDVLNKEFKEAAYNLGKLRLYCGIDDISSRWDHDDNDLPYIVDSKNNPPLFTVKWVDTEEHPKSYAVSDGNTTEFFSDKESAYQKIKDIVKQHSSLEETKDQLFGKILNEAVNPRFIIRATFNCDGVEKRAYYNSMLDNWVADCFPIGQEFGATQFKNEPSEEKLEYVKTVMTNGAKETLECDDPQLVKLEVLTFLITRSYCKLVDRRTVSTALLEAKGDFKKYALLGAAALGLGAVKVADINNIKSTANELNIKVPAIEYSSSHKGAKLIKPIYKYKYDGKGPMDIDSLCKWLERNTEFENIGYEEDGDNYVIKYRNAYYSYADDSSNPKRRTTYGKIDLPKSYFDDWTYSLDENKKVAFFDKLLKE